jgi:ribose/xylose/arabinose/galactoside ABC-type transport system permease subunit
VILSPDAFARPSNLLNIVKQASINGILACGMMFVIISGGIDLSVGSTAALAGVMAAHFSHAGEYPLILPIFVALGIGALVGYINGIGVAYGEIPPFIVTLGTMTAVRGAALIASGGAPVFNVSKPFEYVASGFLLGVPLLAIYFAGIVALTAIILTKTVFGRRVYSVGGNEIAANVSGINVRGMKISVYVIAGTLAGFAGMLLASRTVSGSPTAGSGYELDAIAAVIIGGVSMAGGAGKWYGTVIGALMIAVIGNGLDILGVSSHYQFVIKGAIIVFAVLIDIKSKAKNE